MRVSADRNDSGYEQYIFAQAEGKTIRVFLNGEEATHCFIADEEQGFIERAVLGKDGLIQVDPADNSKILIEHVSGRVEIKVE